MIIFKNYAPRSNLLSLPVNTEGPKGLVIGSYIYILSQIEKFANFCPWSHHCCPAGQCRETSDVVVRVGLPLFPGDVALRVVADT